MAHVRRPLHEVDGAIRRLIPAHRGRRSALSGPCRWYEQKVQHMHAIVDPRSPIWWRQLWYRCTDPIYDFLWHAGLIDVEPGALWSSARLVLPWRTRRYPASAVSMRAWVKSWFLRRGGIPHTRVEPPKHEGYRSLRVTIADTGPK